MTTTLTRLFLACAALGLAAFALHSLTTNEVPASNRDALMVALGVILGLSKDVYAFFFGSSKGSEDKTDLLHNAATGKPDDPVTVALDPKPLDLDPASEVK